MSGQRIGAFGADAEHLRIPAGVLENALRLAPRLGLSRFRAEAGVDSFLGESGLAAGTVQQHHPGFQVRVPVDRRTPERIRVRTLPADFGRKQRRRAAAEPRFVPCALEILVDRARWKVPACKRHARDTNSLPGDVSAVIAEVKVEVLMVAIENHREIAAAAGEISVTG